MKKDQVKIGGTYTAKVSKAIVPVKIINESRFGGWNGVNVTTGRAVRVATAGRLRKIDDRFPQPA